MRNLLAILLKYKFFFFFLALEIIAFTLIINQTFYQRYVLINSANSLTGTLHTWNMSVSDYFSLKQTNQVLIKENIRLRERLKQSLYISDTTMVEPKDSLTQQQYTYIPARVISNSINNRNNYLMIDKGRKHGIDREMAVITSNGVVGIVINVSEHFAWVMSVLNQNTKINGRLKHTNYQGSLSWDGKDYRTGIFNDMPSHVHIQNGDTVVTSGFSLMFPREIMIGTVEEHFVGRGEHFYILKLNFSVDYNRLSHVYVVKNLMREEQLSIMEKR
jgi:rod shape-determining protein MreC